MSGTDTKTNVDHEHRPHDAFVEDLRQDPLPQAQDEVSNIEIDSTSLSDPPKTHVMCDKDNKLAPQCKWWDDLSTLSFAQVRDSVYEPLYKLGQLRERFNNDYIVGSFANSLAGGNTSKFYKPDDAMTIGADHKHRLS